MFAVFRKLVLASVLVLTALTAGAWQSNPVALAQSKDPAIPDAPLYPGFTWSRQDTITQSIRTSVHGDSVSLAGERYAAKEQFMEVLPENVWKYYSNAELAKSGWVSYDVVEGPDGVRYVFSHESGVYLSVEFLTCPKDPTSICPAVWKSNPVAALPAATTDTTTPPSAQAVPNFNKTSPSNDASNVNPSNVVLSWASGGSTVDRYGYCVKAGSACPNNDPNWTSTFNLSVTLTNLSPNTTYYWQVRATDCDTCTPKPWTYANNDTPWTFRTGAPNQVTIMGNAGIGGAVLSYTDGSARTVTADSTGAYTIRVTYNWTGTITPSKAGYFFTPPSASFTNLTASQTIQNFNATAIYTISGNAGLAGVTLSYTNGTPQTATSDANGNYSFTVPAGWSGTVTPSRTAYTFTPPNRTYTNVQANQTAQNYTATFITFTISGNAGTAGATLTYVNVSPQAVTADASGNYSIVVPLGWSGTVIPRKIQFSFSPTSRNYSNVQANQTAQNYTAQNCPSCADEDTVGVFRPSNGVIYLKNLNISGFADTALNYGIAGDYPVTGDWDGDGDATIGVYRNGTFLLRNSNTVGIAEISFVFGQAGDQPIAGDWDGDGDDTIGIFRPSTGLFMLRNSNSAGPADASFFLGNVGDVGIAGDWNGNGTDTTGVFRPSNGVIFLKNTNTSGFADIALNYGIPGDQPVTGDWNNNGIDTIGVYRNGIFYLRNSNTVGVADIVFALGIPGDHPIAGNWDALP